VARQILSHFEDKNGNHGIQTLINLRLVCSTTKNWIDTLPSTFRLLSHSVVHLNFTDVDSHHHVILQRFLDFPPPFSTSVRLTGLCQNTTKVYSLKRNLAKEILQRQFINFWTSSKHHLDSLEVDVISTSSSDVTDFLTSLITSTSVRKLRVNLISADCGSTFPSFLFKMEEIEINGEVRNHFNNDVRKFKRTGLSDFCELQIRNSHLKKFSISITNEYDFPGIERLINAKTNDTQFQFKWYVPFSYYFHYLNFPISTTSKIIHLIKSFQSQYRWIPVFNLDRHFQFPINC